MKTTFAAHTLAVLLLPLTTALAENLAITEYCSVRADTDCASVPGPSAGWTMRFNYCRCHQWLKRPVTRSTCLQGCIFDYANGQEPISRLEASTLCHRICDLNPTCRDPGPCQ